MNDTSWDDRVARAKQGAEAFGPFLGRWMGTGTAHGEPASGELEALSRFDGSFVEVRERTADHEDVCFYRLDPDDWALRVTQLFGGASLREYNVEITDRGLVWVTPPGEPTVEWFFGEELVSEVRWPGEAEPEVRMTWRRA